MNEMRQFDHAVAADVAGLIESLEGSAEQALGLPGRLYYDQQAFEDERTNLFASTWVPIAFASDLPANSTVFPVTFAGWELLVVRDGVGAIRAFHNICRHRGVKLVRQAGPMRTIVCGYHCWGYGLDGALRATPHIGGIGKGAQDMDKESLALLPITAGVWRDLVFVNIDGSAPPLEEHMRPLDARLARYDFDVLELSDGTGRGDMEVAANWKIFIEAGIEDYHLPYIHPKTLPSYSKDYRPERGGDLYGGFSHRRTLDDARARHRSNLDTEQQELPLHPVMVVEQWAEFLAVFIFPLGTVIVSPQGVDFALTLPQTPTRTITRSRNYFVGDAAHDEAHRVAREARSAFFRQVIGEDFEVMESVQAMAPQRESIAMRTRFSAFWEQALCDFQLHCARRLERTR